MKAKGAYPRKGLAVCLRQCWLPTLALWLAFLGIPALPVAATDVQVTVDFPTDGSNFARPTPRVLIAGRAQVSGTLAPSLDLAIVIDRSGSTANPTGADIDGDGTVGELKRLNFPNFRLQDLVQPRSSDPGDSVLAAELAGAKNLLTLLDPAHTRVGVIRFGRSLPVSDAYIEQPLTSNYPEVQKALTRIGALGSQGGTDIAAAIREATAELIGTPEDRVRSGGKRVMLLLSDGFPSFPAGSPDVADPEDIILALRAASLARQAGIEIHTYALGPKAVASPFALTEIARITGGRFNPISDPAQVLYRLKEFLFVQLDSLRVENATLGQPAEQVALGPEGDYIAVVPVKAGVNQIKVTVAASDGTPGGASVLLNYFSQGEPDLTLQPTRREVALGPGHKSFDELKLELEKEKQRWLELNRRTKALELKAGEKKPGRGQLEIDLDVK